MSKTWLNHLNPSTLTYYKQPLHIVRGKMQYLWDSQGHKYLDMIGGIVTVSVGHCHPKVNYRLKIQIDQLWHTSSIYRTDPIVEYAEALTKKLPSHLNTCFFVNSGSEANDLALALARLHTSRFDVLSLRGAYHGGTQAILGATNLGNWKQPFPSGFGIIKMKCPDARGSWGVGKCRDSPAEPKNICKCAKGECIAFESHMAELRDCLDHDFTHSSGPAAFIVESIQGIGGTVQYPKNYLQSAFNTIRSCGGLTISDEVQTGLGRLGSHFCGFESQEAKPDIVTMAKGIANGFPMGAVITSREIANSLGKALYFNTYGGNPLACTVAKAVIEVIEEEELQQNALKVGTFMLKELSKIKSPFIGDIRGKGLMIGVELVENKNQQEKLSKEKMTRIFENIKEKGILLGKGGLKSNVLRIKPPMCINMENATQCVEAISEALKSEE
ncbi:hypothetical protein ACQ4LE_002501 [Meloidogyne hapla]|uniref:Alanine--glyoxylate aminotransferase 2, mitochondrial n=1 Tax=Meloidogyne hapla TaxID=6305 RepID=A0A1I8BUJ4_MELHA